jgi:anti-anti-sigma factor
VTEGAGASSSALPDSVTLAVPHRHVDLATIEGFQALVDVAAAPGSRRVVLDLSEVEFIDLRGCRVLGDTATRLRADGRELVIASARSHVRRMLRLLGADGACTLA